MQDTTDVETPRTELLSSDHLSLVAAEPAEPAVAAAEPAAAAEPTIAAAEDATSAPAVERHVNSVDATVGQPMIDRVMDRKNELQALLLALPETDTATRDHIGLALSTIQELLSGDLENVPPVVTVDMNRWLERNKHLGERPAPVTTA